MTAPKHFDSVVARAANQRRGGPALLVMTGTFAAPLAQWVVFLLVGRVGGSSEAGTFALLFAVATPLVTATNGGLRNGYITLNRRPGFADFVALRLVGATIATVALLLFGRGFGLPAGMVAAVALMKAADSLTDIWYGHWQHLERLAPFGVTMIVNGMVTVSCAVAFAMLGLSGSWIVLGSALGSILTLLSAVALDAHHVAAWLHRGGFVIGGAVRRMWRVVLDCWQIGAGQVIAGLIVSLPTWAVGFFGTPHDVGRFAAAAYMITIGSLLGSSLNAVVLGSYRAEMVRGGAALVRRSARRGTAIITGVGLVAVSVVAFGGVWLFQLLYGPEFTFTPVGLALVALAAALNPGTFLMNAALLAVNAYTAQLTIVGLALAGSTAVAVLVGWLGAPGFLVGAACALVGSLVKYALSSMWLLRVTSPAQSGAT